MGWVIAFMMCGILSWMFMRGASKGNEAGDKAATEYFERKRKDDAMS